MRPMAGRSTVSSLNQTHDGKKLPLQRLRLRLTQKNTQVAVREQHAKENDDNYMIVD